MKIHLDMVGCRLNQAELELLAADFTARGWTQAENPDIADLLVVNTCAVTGEAVRDSRQMARRLHRLNPRATIILTGCWATLEPDAARMIAPDGWVIPNSRKDHLAAEVLGAAGEIHPSSRPAGARDKTRAHIKAQDGCHNGCAFCATRLARGAVRSRSVESVVGDIHRAERDGAQEAVLTGVQLAAWGVDLAPDASLATLLREVLSRTSIPRLRLSSLEPWNLTPGLLELFADRRLCPHLHLPLQSGSADVLRRMRRPGNPKDILAMINRAYEAIPDLAVTSDLLVGFPGEMGSDFAASLDAIRAMAPARVHVFRFSPRPGTEAAVFPGRIPPDEIRRRADIARACAAEMEQRYMDKFVGRTMDVLWEASRRPGISQGLTGNYLRVHAEDAADLRNRITTARLLALDRRGFLWAEPSAHFRP